MFFLEDVVPVPVDVPVTVSPLLTAYAPVDAFAIYWNNYDSTIEVFCCCCYLGNLRIFSSSIGNNGA